MSRHRRNELNYLYGQGARFPSNIEDEARLMPPTSINPDVASRLLDGSIIEATRAFGYKIMRVIRLKELSAYNLPKQSETKDSGRSARLAAEIRIKQQNPSLNTLMQTIMSMHY